MSQEHQWIQASDDEVLEHLRAELGRIKSAASAAEILGCTEPENMRKTFLALTKTHHPNRFARRPEEIRRLAGEVFLRLKEAYERSGSEKAANELDHVRAHAATESTSREIRSRTASSRPPQSPARQELMDRRREQLKNQLATPALPRRTAQIRAATSKPSDDLLEMSDEESRFAAALETMTAGEFSTAAAAFKSLAVGRPTDKRYRTHMYYAQGRVQHEGGHFEEARAEYKRALGLDASFSLAHQAMAKLPDEKQNKKKKTGIFSKLFGK